VGRRRVKRYRLLVIYYNLHGRCDHEIVARIQTWIPFFCIGRLLALRDFNMNAFKAIHLLIVCIAACISFVSGDGDLLGRMRAATATANHGIVRLTFENYTEFTVAKDRTFTMVVLFTAQEPKYGCAVCGMVAREYVTASRSYGSAHSIYYNIAKTDNTSVMPPLPLRYDANADDRLAFFGVVDFRFNQEAFQMHAFTTVPHVVYFPITSAPLFTSSQARQVAGVPKVTIPAENMLSSATTPIAAADILARIGEQMPIPVVRSAMDRLPLSLLLSIVFAVAAAIVSWRPENRFFFVRPWFWTFACFLGYVVSISGFIACIIKGSPWYTTSKDGKPIVFSGGDGHHDQFALEGLVMGGLNLLAGGAVIALISVARSKRASTFEKLVVGVLCLGAFIAVYMRILGYYQDKTKWYRISALFTPDLQRFLSRLYPSLSKWLSTQLWPNVQLLLSSLLSSLGLASK
jgi:hypothetical protein